MTKDNEAKMRRILIVDDQQEIHDTFDRIFGNRGCRDDDLDAFEQRFLGADAKPSQSEYDSRGVAEYELTHVNSGREAIAAVEHASKSNLAFSVAFVDMRMPSGMDGTDTAEALWDIDPNLQIVICTAYSDQSWDSVLRRLGHTDRLLLLKKPFESDEARQLTFALSEKSYLAKIQHLRMSALGREVERRRDTEQQMREMAHRDALTNLPNRPYLIEKLQRIIDERDYADQTCDAVLFLDLDNFKIINDSLGHDAGDVLLNKVADRLKECVRDHDMATRVRDEENETIRLGGDEFVILLERLHEPEDALEVANRIVNRISEPFTLAGRLVTVGTSVGIAYVNRNISDAHETLRSADTAMYRAKNDGKGRVAVFDQTMHEDVVRRMEQENLLRQAIEDEEFELHYQPIIDLTSAQIQGVEVLLRWKNNSGQYVSPSEFVPMIEEIGLIQQVGEWVLEQSMLDMTQVFASVPDSVAETLCLGVNTSSRQLGDPFFLDQLDAILARTGFDRRRLKLEMNEAQDARHSDRIRQTVLELHNSGVGIQIDDFGKGQSSLTCFQAYPIESVKIDRSFIAMIANDHTHSVIAEAIVGLAHHLSAKIVAEGVESIDQLRCLQKWGCDAAQGYLFSPPLTRDHRIHRKAKASNCSSKKHLRRSARSLAHLCTQTCLPIPRTPRRVSAHLP